MEGADKDTVRILKLRAQIEFVAATLFHVHNRPWGKAILCSIVEPVFSMKSGP